jgi:hypothetical protein
MNTRNTAALGTNVRTVVVTWAIPREGPAGNRPPAIGVKEI